MIVVWVIGSTTIGTEAAIERKQNKNVSEVFERTCWVAVRRLYRAM